VTENTALLKPQYRQRTVVTLLTSVTWFVRWAKAYVYGVSPGADLNLAASSYRCTNFALIIFTLWLSIIDVGSHIGGPLQSCWDRFWWAQLLPSAIIFYTSLSTAEQPIQHRGTNGSTLRNEI